MKSFQVNYTTKMGMSAGKSTIHPGDMTAAEVAVSAVQKCLSMPDVYTFTVCCPENSKWKGKCFHYTPDGRRI